MMKVYVCSPYRAKDGAELDRNIEYAQALTRRALKAGLAPITPHLYITQCLDEKKPQERAQGLAAGMELLKGCDFMIVGDKCGEPAKIVHHKRWLNRDNINDTDITLNWDNLEALCQDCHNKEHHKSAPRLRYRFDADGGIIPPMQKRN